MRKMFVLHSKCAPYSQETSAFDLRRRRAQLRPLYSFERAQDTSAEPVRTASTNERYDPGDVYDVDADAQYSHYMGVVVV